MKSTYIMKIGKREKEILKVVGVGLVVGGSLIVPTLPMILAPFIRRDDRNSRQNVRKSYRSLEQKDLIYLSGEEVRLTKRGQELLNKILAEDITIQRTDDWDGVWRIVAYDIPDNHKKERDYFRTRIESLGFVKVQESMFAIPYECKEEIAVFAQSLGLSPFVLFLTTEKIPFQKELLRRFGLPLE